MGKAEDLVQQSGVSRSTVFRFLRGEPVRPKARDAILLAMQKLNIPHTEKAEPTNRVLQIAVRSHYHVFKGYSLAISGFMKRAEQNGFIVQLRAGHPQDLEVQQRKKKNQAGCAGVLILGMTVEEEDFEIATLQKGGIPFVFVNRMFNDPMLSWVSCDLKKAAGEATRHLLSLGHRDIGNWGVTQTSRLDSIKRQGYMEALEEYGCYKPELAFEMHRHGDLEALFQALIDTKRLPSAWFCSSDEHALRMIRVARKNKLRIPEDLAIVGMDAVDDGEFTSPALTTVKMPFETEGAVAFDILRHLMENPNEESVRVVLKHSLVVRESCGQQGAMTIAMETSGLQTLGRKS